MHFRLLFSDTAVTEPLHELLELCEATGHSGQGPETVSEGGRGGDGAGEGQGVGRLDSRVQEEDVSFRASSL